MASTENNIYKKIIFLTLVVLCLTPWISSPVALALGFFTSLLIGNPYQEKSNKYIHLLLKIAIVGLGFGLHLNEALQAGKSGFRITVISIVAVLTLGWILGKLLKLPTPLSYLISTGTAICGGSAIAAVSPIVKPSPKDISVALAIVFTLNSIALFVFPVVGHWLGLSQHDFGLWCAIGIHDTSSVVGAASKYGDEALKIATTVKLARALWIIPLSIATLFMFKNGSAKVKIPWFIGLFVLAILINTYFPAVQEISPIITAISKAGLHLTLFLIGTTLSVENLKNIGIKPLVLALALWIFISVGSLWVVTHYV